MVSPRVTRFAGGVALIFCAAAACAQTCAPSAIAASADGATVYLACSASNKVLWFDTAAKKVRRSVPVPAPPSGLALARDGRRLYVTCAAPHSRILALDTASGNVAGEFPAGHTTLAPVLDRDSKLLYAANRFDSSIAIFNIAQRRQVAVVPVLREPVGLALTPDGRLLFAANSLPVGRSDAEHVAAEVSIIDTATHTLAASVMLPNGSTGLREIQISPDGRFAAVAHTVGRFYLPTTQLDRGWMSTNALSLIDIAGRRLAATVLVDDLDRGAANPWAVQWSPDNRRIAVTHAGTHELSLIDAPALLSKIALSSQDAVDDLAFLRNLRRRIPLHAKGPRAMVLTGTRAWVAGYFSDTLEWLDLDAAEARPRLAIRLSDVPPSPVRMGESLFNDGSICFQGWQSCASCHGLDARADGLNWDLLNDGLGNPKNVKSLLLAHRTPPVMSHGVRESAEVAVRSGIRFILFAQRPEEEAQAIDQYLMSLKPVPGPALVKGRMSASARRGRAVFLKPQTGCAQCHTPGLFTDLESYDVGTRAVTDTVSEFDTPTLVEIWRTAPYLHDGSAATLQDVVTTNNREDKHGHTSHLSLREIDDLVEYLRSL